MVVCEYAAEEEEEEAEEEEEEEEERSAGFVGRARFVAGSESEEEPAEGDDGSGMALSAAEST